MLKVILLGRLIRLIGVKVIEISGVLRLLGSGVGVLEIQKLEHNIGGSWGRGVPRHSRKYEILH